MAKVSLSPILNGIHGHTGGKGVVFYMRKNAVYARQHVSGRNPNTEAQRVMRRTFGDAVREWQAMQGEAKYIFNRKARNLNMSGYNLFISLYIKSKIPAMSNHGLKSIIAGNAAARLRIHPTRAASPPFHLRFSSVYKHIPGKYALQTPVFDAG